MFGKQKSINKPIGSTKTNGDKNFSARPPKTKREKSEMFRQKYELLGLDEEFDSLYRPTQKVCKCRHSNATILHSVLCEATPKAHGYAM